MQLKYKKKSDTAIFKTNKYIRKSLAINKDRFKRISDRDVDSRNLAAPWLSEKEVSIIRRGGYFDEEGVIHRKDGTVQCVGVTKSTGERCRNYALAGKTFCFLCQGNSSLKKKGGEMIYSPFLQNSTIRKMYEDSINNDSLSGVREELALVRGLMASVVGRLERSKDGIQPYDLKQIASVIGEIRQCVTSCVSAEIKMGQLIDIGKVTIVIAQLAKIIDKYVPDKEILKKIANEFDNIIWPGTLASTPRPDRQEPLKQLPEPAASFCI